MQSKEINSEHKEILEKHKKAVESNIKDVVVQEKTAKEKSIIKKEATKKKAIDKEAWKEKKRIVSEKIMDNANKENVNIGKDHEEEPKEPKVVITDEERAERFKRLHAMAEDMMRKRL